MNNFKKTVKEIVMTSVICATFAAAAQLAGSGTARNPFKVSSVEDLLEFADSVNAGETIYNHSGAYVALASDIDMADVEFSGIGNECYGFEGVFDGYGHTIANLAVVNTGFGAWGVGFIGFLGNYNDGAAGTFRNVRFENFTVNAGDFGCSVGLVGQCDAGVIEYVTVNGQVMVAGGDCVGSLVGWADRVAIRASVVSVCDDSCVSGSCCVGALVGYTYGECVVEGCAIEGLRVRSDDSTGGIVGDSYCEVTVNGTEFVEVSNVDEIVPGSALVVDAQTIDGDEFNGETEFGEESCEFSEEEFFAQVRMIADFLAENCPNSSGFADENLDLVKFLDWLDFASKVELIDDLCGVSNLFAAYAFNLPYDTFANAKPSMVTEILNGVPEDGWTTIVLHVKAGDVELDVNAINANVFLKYGQSLDAMEEFLLTDDYIKIVEDGDGYSRAKLVIGPPEGSSAFFKVSVR